VDEVRVLRRVVSLPPMSRLPRPRTRQGHLRDDVRLLLEAAAVGAQLLHLWERNDARVVSGGKNRTEAEAALLEAP
jgi:hypothetical protein